VAEHPGLRHRPEPTERRLPTLHPVVRAGFIEYDRVIFFSDAVFAIAITLLAVNLHVPRAGNVGSAHELHEAIPSISGFAISFLVVYLIQHANTAASAALASARAPASHFSGPKRPRTRR